MSTNPMHHTCHLGEAMKVRRHSVGVRPLLALALVAGGATSGPSHAATDPYPATPGIACGPGSHPEKLQGYVPPEDFKDGRAEQGYNCNADLVSHTGVVGGFRVERYVDAQKHVCAFYDSTRLLGADFAGQIKTNGVGTYAVDMTDPAKPVVTATMATPAMVTPHESLRLNQKRG